MAAVTVHSDFGAQGRKKICHCCYFSPFICHEVMGSDAMIFVFWMLSFKTAFLLSSFTLIKRLFSPSSLSSIRVVSSAYVRLWYFSQQPWFQLVIHEQLTRLKLGTVTDYVLGIQITVDSDCSHEIKRRLLLGRKTMTNLDSVLKKQRHHLANKGPYRQSYGFSRSHLWVWDSDHKEDWRLKKWCFWIVVLVDSWESLRLQGDQIS